MLPVKKSSQLQRYVFVLAAGALSACSASSEIVPGWPSANAPQSASSTAQRIAASSEKPNVVPGGTGTIRFSLVCDAYYPQCATALWAPVKTIHLTSIKCPAGVPTTCTYHVAANTPPGKYHEYESVTLVSAYGIPMVTIVDWTLDVESAAMPRRP